MATIPPCHGVWYEFESRYLGMKHKNAAEHLFFTVMSNRCSTVRWATPEEDMYAHYDIICDDIRYDVKDKKKLNRSDDETSDVVWLELQNVRGDRGWLKGDAHKIAFLADNQFLIVDREKLFEYVKWRITDLKNPFT